MFLLSSGKNINKQYKLSKSDVDFYKMCGVFAAACIFIVLTLKMNATTLLRHATGQNMTYNFYMLCRNPLFMIPVGIVAAAGIIWFIICRVKKVNESMKIFSSTDALGLICYIAVFFLCFGVELNSSRHTFFLVFTIIVSLIYYISKLYNFDFLFYSVMNALFALTLYFTAMRAEPAIVAFKIASIIVFAAVCILVPMKLSNAKVRKGKHRRGYLFIPVYVSLVIWAALMFWRTFVAANTPGIFAINSPAYLTPNAMLVILLVQYIIAAIIYTLRLIRE